MGYNSLLRIQKSCPIKEWKSVRNPALKKILCSTNNFILLSWRATWWIISAVGFMCYLYILCIISVDYAATAWNMESHLLFSSNLFKILPFDPFCHFFFLLIRAKRKWVTIGLGGLVLTRLVFFVGQKNQTENRPILLGRLGLSSLKWVGLGSA